MKLRIQSCKPKDEELDDLDVFFVAVYNLIYEKLEQEPKRGIWLNKGLPTERKVRWKELMEIAHSMEDFFTFRKIRQGPGICKTCRDYQTESVQSPHMGTCIFHGTTPIHWLNRCKHYHRRGSNV